MMFHRDPRTFRPLLSSLVALALLAPGLGQAQDARGGDAPAREGPTQVEGRNAYLMRALAGAARQAAPQVVHVRNARGRLLGYGVVIDDGQVLTCNGILPSTGERVRVTCNGQEVEGTIAGRNVDNDVALLSVAWSGAPPQGLQEITGRDLRIGQLVVVAGSGGEVLAAGVVSAKDRPVEPSASQGNILMGLFSDGNEGHKRAYPKVIHHDAPLMPEHFGAPLLDRQGRLIGINVANPYRGSSHAVGIGQIRTVLADLKAGAGRAAPAPTAERPRSGARPWLGASAAPADADRLALDYRYGLDVREVEGPAKQGGLQPGDVIVALDGQPLRSIDAFADAIGKRSPGDTVRLTVLRGSAGLVHEVEVTLGSR